MLFRAEVVPGLRDGSITLAFRCWKRPTVRAGSELRTPAGVLGIDEVREVTPDEVTDDDAAAAGASSAAELLAGLQCAEGRRLYRIGFHRVGVDPRIALRVDAELDDAARAQIAEALAGWDRRSRTGPWTTAVLRSIEASPGTVSTVLADQVGMDRPAFKRRVRQLKELGLTESLERGYRLSARGRAYLAG